MRTYSIFIRICIYFGTKIRTSLKRQKYVHIQTEDVVSVWYVSSSWNARMHPRYDFCTI